MKHTNSRFVVARIMLIVLTLAIAVFSLASCDSLPPELQGLLGGNPNANCEHYYDNACDTDCNECGTTRKIEHTYENGVCSVCGATDESVPACAHTTVENCVCKDCGATVHNLMLIPGIAPTCEYRGFLESYQCFACGKVFLDSEGTNEVDNNYTEIVIQPLGHNYVNNVCDRCGHCKHLTVENCVCQDCNKPVHLGIIVEYAYIAPTCTENGRIAYLACDDCEAILYGAETLTPITDPDDVIIPALGGEHNYIDGVCDKCGDIDESVPTCEHANVQDCVCMDCNASVHDVEYVPARSSTPIGELVHGLICDIYICYECEEAAYDAELKNIISDQEEWESIYVYPLDHNYVDGICDVCGESGSGISGDNGDGGKLDPVPTCEHTTVENCVCKDCGEEFHKSIELLIPAGDATCDEIGSDVDIYVCYDCEHFFLNAEGIGAMTEDEVLAYEGLIMPTGHNMVNSEYGTYCTKCGREGPYGLNAEHRIDTSTCICEDCGKTIHNFSGDDDNCIYCGESHTHEMKFIPEREATCYRTGYAFDAYKCEICEKLYTDAEGENRVDREDWIIDKLGHNYVNGTCDKCGSYDSFGGSDVGQDCVPDNSSEP